MHDEHNQSWCIAILPIGMLYWGEHYSETASILVSTAVWQLKVKLSLCINRLKESVYQLLSSDQPENVTFFCRSCRRCSDPEVRRVWSVGRRDSLNFRFQSNSRSIIDIELPVSPKRTNGLVMPRFYLGFWQARASLLIWVWKHLRSFVFTVLHMNLRSTELQQWQTFDKLLATEKFVWSDVALCWPVEDGWKVHLHGVHKLITCHHEEISRAVKALAYGLGFLKSSN